MGWGSGSREVSGRRVQALGGWVNVRRRGRVRVYGWGRCGEGDLLSERRVIQWEDGETVVHVVILFHPPN